MYLAEQLCSIWKLRNPSFCCDCEISPVKLMIGEIIGGRQYCTSQLLLYKHWLSGSSVWKNTPGASFTMVSTRQVLVTTHVLSVLTDRW